MLLNNPNLKTKIGLFVFRFLNLDYLYLDYLKYIFISTNNNSTHVCV